MSDFTLQQLWLQQRRAQQQAFLNAVKLDLQCQDCPPTVVQTDPVTLEFDHVRGDKERSVGGWTSWAGMLAELDKCEVVCAIHHRIRTADRRNVGRSVYRSVDWGIDRVVAESELV